MPIRPLRRISPALLPALLSGACATVAEPPAPREVLHRDHPVFSGLVTGAGGWYDHSTQESPLDDDTTAGFYRVQLEGCSPHGVGGGLQVEGVVSDDDLFASQGLLPSRAEWIEFAPYFMLRHQHGKKFRMPVRMGMFFQELELKDATARGSWETVGLRLAAEPEYVFHSRRNLELSIAGELIIGVGGTRIEFTGGGAPRQEFDSVTGTIGFEFGPRIRLGAFTAGISFLHRLVSVSESDPESGLVANGVDARFTGFAATMGVRL